MVIDNKVLKNIIKAKILIDKRKPREEREEREKSEEKEEREERRSRVTSGTL